MSLSYYESQLSAETLIKINSFLPKIVCHNGLTPLVNIAKVIGIQVQSLNLKLNDFNRVDREIYQTNEHISSFEHAKALHYVGANVWQTKLYRPYETLVMYFYAVQRHQENIKTSRKLRGY